MTPKGAPILLFDGVCNLCNGVVQFVIRQDPKGKILFASQQSNVGQRLLDQYNLPDLQSVILIEGDKVYRNSDAALRLFHHLGGYWAALEVFKVIPSPFRNWVYRLIAGNRYRLFGKRKQCMIPTPEVRKRFLDL